MNVSPLRVGNEEFLVTSLIERCPKSMMLRELVKNGLESAALAQNGDKRVEIGSAEVEGTRKLCIWNTGPGMDADELYRMCDLASSIGKQQALDENFGMGAKVASLPSNQFGIRYRSCKDGAVHQVVMGKRDGIYGRVKQAGPDGTSVNVLDVTAQAAADGRDLSYDWTEVVLLGNRSDQDTLADPYDGNPASGGNWITHDLTTRFFRLPPDINLVLCEPVHRGRGRRNFVAIGDRLRSYAQHEAVGVAEGVTIHFLYDAADPKDPASLLSAQSAVEPLPGAASLVYRDELYDYRIPYFWQRESPIYGIPFGARNISVFVELPSNYPLVPDAYRQFLRRSEELQAHIAALDFAPLARDARPAWLIDLLQNFAPGSNHIQSVRDEMYELFKSLGVRRRWWSKEDLAVTEARRRGALGVGTPPKEPEVFYEAAPEIVPLRDVNDIAHRGLYHNAARFYPETHQLFVNTNYVAFTAMASAIETEFAALDDQERVRGVAQVVTEQALIRQICRKLAYGLAKRDLWDEWQVDAALSSFSLTLAADDYLDQTPKARELARTALGDAAANA